MERAGRGDGPAWPCVMGSRAPALRALGSGARGHAPLGRLARGDAATHGPGHYALTGRASGRGRETARAVSQAAQTGTRGVDVCGGERGGTHQESGGAPLTAGGLVAAAQFRHAECGGQAIRRTPPPCHDHLTPTETRRAGLLDVRLCRSDLPRPRAFSLAADFPTALCSVEFFPRCALTNLVDVDPANPGNYLGGVAIHR